MADGDADPNAGGGEGEGDAPDQGGGGTLLADEGGQQTQQGQQGQQAPATEAPEWLQNLGIEVDPEIAGAESLKQFQTPQDAIKGLVHAQKMVGADKVAKPGPNATDEELEEFRKALGKPEKPDEYEMPTENLAAPLDDDDMSRVRQVAHELGVDKQQAAVLARKWAEVKAEAGQAQQQSIETRQNEAKQALQQEWGEAYDEQLGLAKQGIEFAGGEELLKQLAESHEIGNNPDVLKAFAKIGKMVAQDEVVGGGRSQSFRMTPDAAERQITAIKMDGDKSKALIDSDHPQHREVQNEYLELVRIAQQGKKPQNFEG